jgi:tRNA A37 methylthiotransferase MiaB
MKGKHVYIENGGCIRRQLDLETIQTYLQANGYELVDHPRKAGCILVSTCAFKKKEEDRSYQRLKTLQAYPARILALGCLPDIAPERFESLGNIGKIAPKELRAIDDFFVHDKLSFTEIADSPVLTGNEGGLVSSLKKSAYNSWNIRNSLATDDLAMAWERLKRRLKSADKKYHLFVCRGCQGLCSYCAVRRAIGPIRSKPIAQVVEQLREGYQKGYRHFPILGDDPGCYGLDIGTDFPSLLGQLLTEASRLGIRHGQSPVFHIHDIHPKFVIRYQDELARLSAARACQSILLPLQSGSDRILQLMEREHTVSDLVAAVQAMRKARPDLELTTQIIVGFPSETEEDFRASLRAVHDAQYSAVVVFPYHDKTGTNAAELHPKTPEKIIRKRKKAALRFFRDHGIKAYPNRP